MRRLPTTLAFGIWGGYLAVASCIDATAVLKLASADVSGIAGLDAEVERVAAWMLDAGNAAIFGASVAAVWTAMTAAILATALWLTHQADRRNRMLGERLAAGGVGAIALFGLCAWAGGLPIPGSDGSIGTFAVLLALSVVSVAFDRLVETDDVDDGDFEASAIRLGEAMARNALLTPASLRDDYEGPER